MNDSDQTTHFDAIITNRRSDGVDVASSRYPSTRTSLSGDVYPVPLDAAVTSQRQTGPQHPERSHSAARPGARPWPSASATASLGAQRHHGWAQKGRSGTAAPGQLSSVQPRMLRTEGGGSAQPAGRRRYLPSR